MKRIAVAPLACLLGAMPAPATSADNLPAVATLEREARGARRIVAYPEIVWRCAGVRCVGASEDRRMGRKKACRDVARQLGPVITFLVGGEELTREELARCNRGIR